MKKVYSPGRTHWPGTYTRLDIGEDEPDDSEDIGEYEDIEDIRIDEYEDILLKICAYRH